MPYFHLSGDYAMGILQAKGVGRLADDTTVTRRDRPYPF